MQTGSSRDEHYIAGFDGIRAIAVIMVLLGHGNLTPTYLRPEFPLLYNMVSASRGVDIFFVLSGFLITRLLLGEYNRYGSIDIRNFYIKRAFRLLPLYYLFCAVMIALVYGASTLYKLEKLPWLLGNAVNFAPRAYASAMDNHLWSLAVEWHFYLVWPLVFVILAGYRRIWLMLFLLTVLAICAATYQWLPRDRIYNYASWSIPSVAPIVVGALAAVLLSERRQLGWWALPLGISIYAWPLITPVPYISHGIRATGVALIIVWIFCNQKNWIVSALEFWPLRFIGRISYGLYVWHGLFMGTGPFRATGQTWPPSQATGFILTVLVAPLSYYGYEQRVQALQKRFLRPPPTNSHRG